MDRLNLTRPLDATTLSENLTLIEAKINQIVEKVTTQESLISLLSINSPKIYPQIDLDYRDNIISIRADKSIQACSGIIYVLPNETLEETLEEGPDISPKLEVNCVGDDPLIFSIKKEKPEGGLTNAQAGDIVANRLALFRINPTDRSEMILINPTLNSGAVLTDVTLQNAVFINTPEIKTMVNNSSGTSPVVTEDDLEALREEFEEEYLPRFAVSTYPLEIYNQSHTLKDGQIFIQIEDVE